MSEFVGRIDQLDSIELDNELRNVFIKQLREVFVIWLLTQNSKLEKVCLGGEIFTSMDPGENSSGIRSFSGIVPVFLDILFEEINHGSKIIGLES